jgi:enterochelin esterase-like enzyme
MEFLEGLVPSIEAAYRADPRPAARAVAGISRGGVWALEIAFRRPAEFPAVAALSPALQVNLARAAYDPMKLAGSTPDLPQAIFLGAGENDWARWETETLAQALSARGVPVSWALVPGVHADATWQALIPQMLAFLTQGWGIGP